jgi:hypothetical protein
LGSSAGQLIIGYTQNAWGYLYGFWLIVSVDISLALIPITILLIKEIREYKKIKKCLEKLTNSGLSLSIGEK